MVSLHRVAENLCTKFRNRDLAGAECRGREHAGEVRDVKDGSGVQVGPAFGVAHPVVEVVDVSKDVRMRYHDAFRPAGCAARIDKPQNGLGIIKDLWNGAAADGKGLL